MICSYCSADDIICFSVLQDTGLDLATEKKMCRECAKGVIGLKKITGSVKH